MMTLYLLTRAFHYVQPSAMIAAWKDDEGQSQNNKTTITLFGLMIDGLFIMIGAYKYWLPSMLNYIGGLLI